MKPKWHKEDDDSPQHAKAAAKAWVNAYLAVEEKIKQQKAVMS